MAPEFFYFDFGNVLFFFSHERSAGQMAAAAGVEPALVWQVVFEGDLQTRYETGELSSRQFHDEFCRATGSRPDYDELLRAAGDIFEVNVPVKALVSMLQAAGYRTGVLSNTCEAHWDWCAGGRFGAFPRPFEVLALSYELGVMKPELRIFEMAADLAGVPPGQIFFVDDRPEHVAAARQVGYDAVLYTSPLELARQLYRREVRFNY
jgi:glucose-1-phosphatase